MIMISGGVKSIFRRISKIVLPYFAPLSKHIYTPYKNLLYTASPALADKGYVIVGQIYRAATTCIEGQDKGKQQKRML